MPLFPPNGDADSAQLRLLGLMKDYSRLLRSHCDHLLTLRSKLQLFLLILAGITTLGTLLLPVIQYLDDKAKSMDSIGKPYTYILILVMLGASSILLLGSIIASASAMFRQWVNLKSEIARILPRFERLISYFYQIEEQGTPRQEFRLELDLCLVEAESALAVAKNLVRSKSTESERFQQIDTIRKAAFAIAKAARGAVEVGRRDIKALSHGEMLAYAKNAEGVEDYFVGRFRDEWSSKTRLVNDELKKRLTEIEGLSDDDIRSPKTLDDVERIAEALEMSALKLPRTDYPEGRKKMVRLDMQSVGAVVRSAKELPEVTRRREAILLLEKYIEEVKHGGLSANIEQLQSWLKELRQIELE